MGKFLGVIFGLASLISFCLGAFEFITSIKSVESIKDEVQFYDQFVQTFTTLSFIIFVFIVLLFVLIIHFTRKVDKLETDLVSLPKEVVELENKYNSLVDFSNKLILLNKISTENSHNVFHFFRNITVRSDRILYRAEVLKQPPNNNVLEYYFLEFESFIGTLLANISAYFSIKTGDQCAACIKILKRDNLRTFYRDPISYRNRKRSDLFPDGTQRILPIEGSYAFELITDPDVKYTTFQSDNLFDHPKYTNITEGWANLYNACMVVPIAINLKGSDVLKRDTKGFLCIDNFKGGFENREALDFLCCFADILYNLFAKYERLVNLVQDGSEIKNERFQLFTNW